MKAIYVAARRRPANRSAGTNGAGGLHITIARRPGTPLCQGRSRAGSALPRNQIHIEENQYLLKIQRAGGFKQYEAQVKKSLAATLVPKFPQIPAEVIPTVVEFWAHAGDY